VRTEARSDRQLRDQELVAGKADRKYAVEELGAAKFLQNKPGLYIMEPVWGWELRHTGIDQGGV
jgi:hypothetical protein